MLIEAWRRVCESSGRVSQLLNHNSIPNCGIKGKRASAGSGIDINIKNPFSIIWICLVFIKEMAFFSYLRTILSLTLHTLHGYKFHSARRIYLEHEVLQLPVQQKMILRLNTYTAVTEQLREKEMKKFLETKRSTRKRNQVLGDLGKSLTEMQNSIGKARKGKLKNFCDIDDNLACSS